MTLLEIILSGVVGILVVGIIWFLSLMDMRY